MVHPARPVNAPVVAVAQAAAIFTATLTARATVTGNLIAAGVVRGAHRYRSWPGPGQTQRRGKT